MSCRAPQNLRFDRGTNRQTFVVYKQVVCHFSLLFRAAFNSSMVEGRTNSMTLENVEARVFGMFVHWLYTQHRDGMEAIRTLVDLARFHPLAYPFIVLDLRDKPSKNVSGYTPSDDPPSGNDLKGFQEFAASKAMKL